MWLKAQNEMAGFLPHAAMGPVERMVRPHFAGLEFVIPKGMCTDGTTVAAPAR